MADEKVTQVPAPDVVAQEPKLVGDDETQAEVHEVKPEVEREPVAAQVAQPRESDRDKVDVHETSVKLDRVITDTSDPLAVQVPDAGRGSLDLPIHRLDAPTVEEVFAEEAASVEEREGDAPSAADPNPAASDSDNS